MSGMLRGLLFTLPLLPHAVYLVLSGVQLSVTVSASLIYLGTMYVAVAVVETARARRRRRRRRAWESCGPGHLCPECKSLLVRGYK